MTTDGYDIGDWLIAVAEANERDGSREDTIERFIVYIRDHCVVLANADGADPSDDDPNQV